MRHAVRMSWVLLVFLSALSPSLIHAGVSDRPPALPGWEHGIALSGNQIIRSSPVIADIDGFPANGKEVAVGGSDGTLYVYKSNGARLWQQNVMPYGCSGGERLHSGPAVGQIFGNGIPYVVVGYGTADGSDCDGGIVVYDGRNGGLSWRFSLREWARRQGYREDMYGVISSPALADTDGDGRMEIGFGGFDRNIYLLNADGSVRWYYHAADTVWSSPAFVNVDSDPRLEMVIGQDISPDPASGWYGAGGFVNAFKTTPANPVRIEDKIWQTFLPAAVFSSPVIGDVLPGNPGLEVVIGTSCNPSLPAPWLKILNLSNGKEIQTLNAPSCIQSSAALGDIDDDGLLEVVANAQGDWDPSKGSYQGRSRVVAWKPTVSSDPLWVRSPQDSNGGITDPYGSDLQSPVIADLDGNGSLDVVTANFWSIVIFDGKTGTQLTCENGDTCGSKLTVSSGDMLKSTPAVGDVNNDGKLDVVIGGTHVFANGYGRLYGWTGFAGLLKSSSGNQAAYSAPWPMWRGNPQHTGVLKQLTSSMSSITALLQVGQSTTLNVSFASSDSDPFNYTISENSNLVQLNRTSGTAADSVQVTLTAPATPGTSTTSLLVRASGYPDLTIPIRVVAANRVYKVFIPAVRR